MLMKKNLFFLGTLLAIAALVGCAEMERRETSPIAGSWINSEGTVWTLHPDGTFDADVRAAQPFRTSGRYSISGDQLTVYDIAASSPRECREPGIYRFRRTGDRLDFTIVKDDCGERARQVPLGWRLRRG
jgi:hypothetical protein